MTSFGKRLAPAAQSAALMPQNLPARLLLREGSELRCEVTAIDPDSALFLTAEAVTEGSPVTAYIEEIGRVDGTVAEPAEAGFWVNFSFAENRQPRFIRHLRWLIRRERGLAAAERRHTRYEPRNTSARFNLPGGRVLVVDVKCSIDALRSRWDA